MSVVVSDKLKEELRQVRMNELCGKYVHNQLLKGLRNWTTLTEVLCILIPIAYLLPESIITLYLGGKVVSAILAIGLLMLAILRNILRWDDRLMGHRITRSNNIRSAYRAQEILNNPNATEEEAREFLRYANEPLSNELNLLEDISEKVRQKAYREALKEFDPSENPQNIACPQCNKSIWKFKPGGCQLCGGGH